MNIFSSALFLKYNLCDSLTEAVLGSPNYFISSGDVVISLSEVSTPVAITKLSHETSLAMAMTVARATSPT